MHYTTLIYFNENLIELPDGRLVAEVLNPAVEESLLKEIWDLMANGISWKDIIQRLRPRTVPSGYAYCTWHPG